MATAGPVRLVITYLHSGLAQAQPVAQLLPHESVRVVGLVEQPLQLVQLLQREVGPAPAGLVSRGGLLLLAAGGGGGGVLAAAGGPPATWKIEGFISIPGAYYPLL